MRIVDRVLLHQQYDQDIDFVLAGTFETTTCLIDLNYLLCVYICIINVLNYMR